MAALLLRCCGTLGEALHLGEPRYTHRIPTLPTSHRVAERIKYDSVAVLNVCLTLISCLIPAVTKNLARAKSRI